MGIFDFTEVEIQPEFPGGITKFYEFIARNLRYPAEAVKNNTQGRVFISFLVEKDGNLSNIKITRDLGSGTGEEALRVVSISPKWKPGILFGEPVRVMYNININFSLN